MKKTMKPLIIAAILLWATMANASFTITNLVYNSSLSGALNKTLSPPTGWRSYTGTANNAVLVPSQVFPGDVAVSLNANNNIDQFQYLFEDFGQSELIVGHTYRFSVYIEQMNGAVSGSIASIINTYASSGDPSIFVRDGYKGVASTVFTVSSTIYGGVRLGFSNNATGSAIISHPQFEDITGQVTLPFEYVATTTSGPASRTFAYNKRATDITAWGDSLTAQQASGTQSLARNLMQGYTRSQNVNTFGIGGAQTYAILNNMNSHPEHFGDITVIWAGNNDIIDADTTNVTGFTMAVGTAYQIVARTTLDFTTAGAPDNSVGTIFQATSARTLGSGDAVVQNQETVQFNVLRNISQMVRNCASGKYLVLSLINKSERPAGSYGYTLVKNINTALASTYPNSYLDIRSYLLTQGTGSGLDAIDMTNGVTPPSLRNILLTNVAGDKLVVNEEYTILSRSTLDFTTAGAPDNNIGTSFRCTSAMTLGSGDSVNYIDVIHFSTRGYQIVCKRIYDEISARGWGDNASEYIDLPGAPADVTVSAGDGQATVNFSTPASDGGSTIIWYTVTAYPGDVSASGPEGPITVTGLTNGVAYTFTVTASNAAGAGVASASSGSVTPSPSADGVPVPALGACGLLIAAGSLASLLGFRRS